MDKIILVRHAESNQNLRVKGGLLSLFKYKHIVDPDVVITQEGIKQSKDLAIFLKEYIDKECQGKKIRFWSSTYLRGRQTTDEIRKAFNLTNNEIFYDCRLREQNFGKFDGVPEWLWWLVDLPSYLHYKKMSSSPRGRFICEKPLGESNSKVYDRSSSFIETIFRDKDIDVHIIISHGVFIRTFLMRFFHYDEDWYYAQKNPNNCSTILIDVKNKLFKNIYK
ncbi:MAG: phosphoglycerate mutase family protein [Clostridia bacterium]|nr:phosphoglycerate mutase family protein [Clostridia bacterium]